MGADKMGLLMLWYVQINLRSWECNGGGRGVSLGLLRKEGDFWEGSRGVELVVCYLSSFTIINLRGHYFVDVGSSILTTLQYKRCLTDNQYQWCVSFLLLLRDTNTIAIIKPSHN